MRALKIGVVVVVSLALSGCGWSGNQKEGVRQALETGITKGLAKTGATIDEGVKNAFFDCWVGKITERFKSFDEFKENQKHADVKTFRTECDEQTNFSKSIKLGGK
jgi:hypothetical protein